MNWKKLGEKFPFCYMQLKNFKKDNPHLEDGRQLIEDYLESQGYNAYPSFINVLRKHEEALRNDISPNDVLEHLGIETIRTGIDERDYMLVVNGEYVKRPKRLYYLKEKLEPLGIDHPILDYWHNNQIV